MHSLPSEVKLDREEFKAAAYMAGLSLASTVIVRAAEQGEIPLADYVREVVAGHVKLALSFENLRGMDFTDKIEEWKGKGKHEAAALMEIQQVCIEYLPPGHVNEFDQETVFEYAMKACNDQLARHAKGLDPM